MDQIDTEVSQARVTRASIGAQAAVLLSVALLGLMLLGSAIWCAAAVVDRVA